jgi:uncharacterized protein
MRMAVLGLIAPVFLASCDMLDEPPPLAPAKPAALLTATIRIDTTNGPKALSVEIAADAVSQERGLMYRTQLAPDAGMLFDFHQEVRVSFWMKNTPLPLDMVFIKKDGTVSSVEPNAIPYSTAPIPSAEPVRAVLEINGGRARDLGIKPGDRVRAPIFHDMD